MTYAYLPPIPAIYDHAYDGLATETILDRDHIRRLCINSDYGCAKMFGQICNTYLVKIGPGGVAPRTQELIRRHEIAHCNGWRH